MPRRNPKNDTQWERKVHEQVRRQFANGSNEDGQAEDPGADFLDHNGCGWIGCGKNDSDA